MHLMEMAPSSVPWVLRAMRAVAESDGETHPLESQMIEVAARLCAREGDAPVDWKILEPCGPEVLGDAGLGPKDAERLLQACILVALLDGEIAPAELASIRAFASATGIHEPRVRNLAQLAKGATLSMWVDLARRSFARGVFEDMFEREGLKGIWKIVGPMLGRAQDPELARRYIALGELPENTTGHAYFRFLVDNELPFPGEKGAVSDAGLWHDLSHVIGGYGTDPQGELDVVCFIAGFSRADPFFWLYTIILQFHLGVRVSPYSQGGEGYFDPAHFEKAFSRGAKLKVDLSEPGFDPWPYFPRDLTEVREELGLG